MSDFGKGERAPWGHFPRVIRNGELGSLQGEPEYLAAKAGDEAAALNLVARLLSDATVERIKAQIRGEKPRLLPVLAVEASGNNKIPLAIAEVLADRLGLEVELGIIQSERVGRTGAGADHRLAFNPMFDGPVEQGQTYILLDDTLTMGGTVASLRGFIENRGGHAVAAMVMTAHEGALDLPVKAKMLAAIEAKHGPLMNQFWKEEFGYGVDRLTQGEAGHLRSAASVDAIRERITTARHEGLQRMDARGAAPAAQAKQPELGNKDRTGDGDGIEREYQRRLGELIERKQVHASQLEDHLRSMIERSRARLIEHEARVPGWLAMPSARQGWKSERDARINRVQTLQARLERVRQLRDGSGPYGSRLEALAVKRLRSEDPDLADAYNRERELARRRQADDRLRAKQGRNRAAGRKLDRDEGS